jgi:chemotaxis protein methyltransferase CheR
MSPGPDCVSFLQWALPRLGRRWAGYRRVRRQVCRRVGRRARELGLDSLDDYRRHLERHPGEWQALDALTNITISRFCRDRGVFAFLSSEVLADRTHLRAWSAGCASGEEAYTLAILWELGRTQATGLEILATDVEPAMLRRAATARYPPSALRELPPDWRAAAFAPDRDELVLRPRFRRHVTVARHDIRSDPPPGPFDLVLCRNAAFTYFDDAGQRATLRRIAAVTGPGAVLVLGAHEHLPAGEPAFTPAAPEHRIFRRAP